MQRCPRPYLNLVVLLCAAIVVSCTKPYGVHRLWEKLPELKVPSDYSEDVLAAMDSLYGPYYEFYHYYRERFEVEWQAVDSSGGKVELWYRYVVDKVLDTDTLQDGTIRTWFVTYSEMAHCDRYPGFDFCVAVRYPDGRLRAISMRQSGYSLPSTRDYELVAIGPTRKAFMIDVFEGHGGLSDQFTFMMEPRDSTMQVVGAFHTMVSDDGVELATGTNELYLIPLSTVTNGYYDLLALRRDTPIQLIPEVGADGRTVVNHTHIEYRLPYISAVIRYSSVTDCYVIPTELLYNHKLCSAVESIVWMHERMTQDHKPRASWRTYTTPEHIDSLLRHPPVHVPDPHAFEDLIVPYIIITDEPVRTIVQSHLKRSTPSHQRTSSRTDLAFLK